jgi:hypothetical protein
MARPFQTKTTEELRQLLWYFNKTKDLEGVRWIKDEALHRLLGAIEK